MGVREIKFRAWDKEGCKMMTMGDLFGADKHWFKSLFYGGREDVALMQYTGLKDKNGKEIYEGDVVYAQANEGKYEVKFGIYACEHNDTDDRKPTDMGFYIERFNDKFHNRADSQEGLGEADRYLEVIGNIYENPELLEAKS
jgi:uncharacterized phage protein (TIGR01671 family)